MLTSIFGEEEPLIYLSRYQVKSFIVMLGEEKLELDHSNILAIEYLCDYDYNLFAVLKVQLRIDIRRRLWILKNKTDIRIKFEVDTIGHDKDLEEYNTSPVEVWNEEFIAHFNDDDDSLDISMLEERLAKNDEDGIGIEDIETENYYETQNVMDLYLFHPDLLSSSRTMSNKVYTEDTMQNIVAHLLKDTDHSKVLMSKFENDEQYPELLLPPNHARHNLVYLDQYYGFYEKGSMIFYDIDKLFILNLNGKVTAKEDEEWTDVTFLIRQQDESLPGNAMIEAEDHEIYYIQITEENINIQKPSISNDTSLGSECVLVSTNSTTIDMVEADQSFIDERNTNLTFIQDENKYIKSMMAARLEENEAIVYIDGMNLNINAFKPNREYKLVYEDATKQVKYGSMKFRISYVYHYLKLESEGHMVAAHQFILKRTEGGETS